MLKIIPRIEECSFPIIDETPFIEKPVHLENMKMKSNYQLLLLSFEWFASVLSNTVVELLFIPDEERVKRGGVDCFFPLPFSEAAENKKDVRFV